MVAETLANAGVQVVVLERMATIGRKFLVAGRGGLNLTHTEPLEQFLDRYGNVDARLTAAVEAFGPSDLRAWCAGLGEEPFVGSSGRVFPASFRATPLLRNWRDRLVALGVEIKVRTPWTGWDATPEADAVVLTMGGASWPRTGSDGAWAGLLQRDGVAVTPLRAANCGFTVRWSDAFRDKFAGHVVKNVSLIVGDVIARGDTVISNDGIEAGPVYSVSSALRDALEAKQPTPLTFDLTPDLSEAALTDRLARRRDGDSASSWLRRAGLPPVAIGLLREATNNALPEAAGDVARLVKRTPVQVISPYPIDRAISTAGGVAFSEIDDSFMLRARPGFFVAGEMLDWEAPTGGYLLQATFSTAVAAAKGVLAWLGEAVSAPEPAAPQ